MDSQAKKKNLPSHPFLNFSCQIYEKTQDILLGMQQRHGLNIHLLLFCLWFADSNQGLLTKMNIKKSLTAIHIWHERIVLPLRALRQTLKNSDLSTWQAQVRRDIFDTEIMAEQIEELILADAAPQKISRYRPRLAVQKATIAWQNIISYSQMIFVYFNALDCQQWANLFMTAFPGLTENEAREVCNLQRQKVITPTRKQQKLSF